MEISNDILIELIATLKHSRIFITSREKMHPSGIALYDDLLDYFSSHVFQPEDAADGQANCCTSPQLIWNFDNTKSVCFYCGHKSSLV